MTEGVGEERSIAQGCGEVQLYFLDRSGLVSVCGRLINVDRDLTHVCDVFQKSREFSGKLSDQNQGAWERSCADQIHS